MTALPHAYYPEHSWQDDLEFGATQLALAGRILGDRRSDGWLAAAHWARAYLRSEARDTLNLYDTSALAHTDLVRLLRSNPPTSGLEVTEAGSSLTCAASSMSASRPRPSSRSGTPRT